MDEKLYQKLDQNIAEIKDTIFEIKKDISEGKIISAIQSEQLAEHMRRSLANEEAVKTIAAEVKPIQEHVAIMNFMGKSLTWLIGAGGLLTLINQYFN